MNKKIRLKKILLNTITIIVFIIGLIIIHLSINKTSKDLYNYQIKKDASYQVFLKENSFYDDDSLKNSNFYPGLGIENYNIDFKYFYQGNKNLNTKYKYKVIATIIGKHKSNNIEKTVWVRDFILKPNEEARTTNKYFNINQNIKIDYNYYNNLIHDYEKEYKILIDATLNIKLVVEVNLDLENKSFNKNIKDQETINDIVEVTIKLSDTVSNIDTNYEPFISKNIPATTNKNKTFYLGLTMIIFSILFQVIQFILHFNVHSKNYQDKIKHILKEYKELIVTVKSEPDISNLKIMHLIIFDDLIDVAMQNNVNIIYFEKIKNQKSNLYVIVNDYVYIYIITNEN